MKNKVRFTMLRKAAWDLAYRFQAKVYLVGSYIQKDGNAHDIDLFLVLNDEQWDRLFGEKVDGNIVRTTNLNKILTFRVKQKKHIEEYVKDMDIDFKVAKESDFYDHRGDRICLNEIQD